MPIVWPEIKASRVSVGNYVEIDPTADIKAEEVIIGNYVKIGAGFKARVSDRLTIGDCSTIGHDVSFTGRFINLGDYVCVKENVVIGGGQSMSERSYVKIGRGCLICENVLINDADTVTIGDDVGLGKEVDIWTHGGFLNPLEGFPYTSAPVTIGKNVWIPSRTTILAGVTIGDNVVVGNHSLVNINLPSGCFAGGVPVRIIKEKCYPKPLEYKFDIIMTICEEYRDIMIWRGFVMKCFVTNHRIEVCNPSNFNIVTFDCNTMKVEGELDDFSEDFRDHLRRHGVKFYTGKPFKSITPPAFRKLEEIQ